MCKIQFYDINKKLECAFEETGIPKIDTCVLWANLSCYLLYNEKLKKIAYPLLGSLYFKDNNTEEYGFYNDENNSFHVANLYFSEGEWYLLDFSTKYLFSTKFCKIISLVDTPIKINVPELKDVDYSEINKIEKILKSISKISIETEDYCYSFCPQTIMCELSYQNDIELGLLEEKV
ncbi:hypothetical protein KAR50_09425 [Periweissella fabaria]|uniref:Uncharacterized protein n=1 Tax=Periweissella fabaria TaxID=546157 RepID=A0ABN8BG42_9LACO|nr:hypothetical protein [Periweissella fabaria]MCM0598050.1 hypothetical protein [Periweissella fabaria]CAH0415886.1 hypothetical protein WFA24289_00184 [Periweissella fabaria]